MTIEEHQITDRESWLAMRREDITASAAAALLGIHPFLTRYSLWAEKTGQAPPEEGSVAMERGLELEPIAMRRLAKQKPDWHVRKPDLYFRDPEARLGATPDCFAIAPDRDHMGIVQIKSVEPGKFYRDWKNDAGEVEPPMWICVQALVEAHLTGARWAAVAALVISYGIDLHVVDVPLHEGIIERVREETAKFWKMVAAGEEPEPNFAQDGDMIRALLTKDDGPQIDLTDDNMMPSLVDEDQKLGTILSEAQSRRKEVRAEILHKMGNAARATIAGGRTVTAKTVHKKAYEVKPSSYRNIRVIDNDD